MFSSLHFFLCHTAQKFVTSCHEKETKCGGIHSNSACVPTQMVAKPSPDFLQWLSNYRPALKPYMTAFKRDGWETVEALQAMTVEDMVALDMKPGHRAVLKEALKTL